ncbi:MAG TPA: mechanosensitive ion channel domain-containing protein [Candidatus Angelobacter sp.]|nr:mechanosensitive ion channel domain-containing protein [Candidatus Angelobacter sp.]
MSKKTFSRTLFASITFLAAIALVGAVLYRYWINSQPQPRAEKPKPPGLVDEQPLVTAQRLAALATTPEEQEFSKNALRVSDHEVDMTFATALHRATEHPPAIPAAAKPILAQIQTSQQRVTTEQQDVTRLKQQLAKADDSGKPGLQDKLDLAQAMLEVDQEDLDALHQELIRLGGDPRSKIQELKDQHEALDHAQPGAAPGSTESTVAAQNQSRILMVQFRNWREQSAKANELGAAREELRPRLAHIADERQKINEEQKEEKSDQPQAEEPAAIAQTPAASPAGSSAPDKYSALRHAAAERRHLANLDKRAADFQQLDSIYSGWAGLVAERKHTYGMGVFEGICWIIALLIPVIFANRLVLGLVARLAPDSRHRHTVRIAARFAVQVAGVCLILLVIFGPPSQLATVLALAGAGLTVALKDFIVGFFGWFVLMGPNGIRPGDWVEINGIGGEVVEVGLLHTVILETGNWSDAGHPTGRKVTVVNSFAIEGHYFNFSTTGQWLWDEIEVPIPAGVDPYPVAEAVLKAIVKETQANMQLAEQEWQRAVPSHVGHTFTPAPAITVRPTSSGVNVIVRYITRAHERHEVRSRLFRHVVELLRSKHIASAPIEIGDAKSATATE